MKKVLLSTALLAAIGTAHAADAIQWNQVSLTGESIKLNGLNDHLYGAAIAGSYLLNDNIFVLGKAEGADSDVTYNKTKINVKISRQALGLGYRYAVNERTDVFARGQFQHYKTEASTSVSSAQGDSNAVALGGGIRTMLIKEVELAASLDFIRSTDSSDTTDSNDTELGLSANYHFNDRFALGLSYVKMDDIDFVGAKGTLSF